MAFPSWQEYYAVEEKYWGAHHQGRTPSPSSLGVSGDRRPRLVLLGRGHVTLRAWSRGHVTRFSSQDWAVGLSSMFPLGNAIPCLQISLFVPLSPPPPQFAPCDNIFNSCC
jgi:hypothetical protein